jgi:hypothetical protein
LVSVFMATQVADSDRVKMDIFIDR